MQARPSVSVIVPCRNERPHIARCLDSILSTTYPSDQLEVLVIDGSSDDGTQEVLTNYVSRDARVAWIENPKQTTPAALNIGVRRARGDAIIIMGAHCRYPRDYVGGLVQWLERSGADVVGGICRTVPANDAPRARAIAVALAHPFGVGNSHFRIGVAAPRWVETVPFGCYRRSVFERTGLFDEELVRNQDDEFNYRLLTRGGRLLLVPEIASEYVARDSISKLARMFYQYGYFKPLVARKLRRIVTVRQLVPAAFVAGLLTTLALAVLSPWMAVAFGVLAFTYASTVTLFATRAAPSLGAEGAVWLAAAFPVVHLSYGVGFLRGAVDFIIRGRNGVPNATAVRVSR
jgi:glycosyltransferase involved in cell wall biosynthesis